MVMESRGTYSIGPLSGCFFRGDGGDIGLAKTPSFSDEGVRLSLDFGLDVTMDSLLNFLPG